jgi:hypothetical protein
MEINSNDLNESNHQMRDLNFETKNSVNCSWKHVEKNEEKHQQMEIEKNKNFTFVQSEIDTEFAKNILYSDTGIYGPQDENRQSISSIEILKNNPQI